MRLALVSIIAVITLVPIAWAEISDDVSIVRLIATPKEFDGKRVQVIGVPKLEFEGTALYLHKEDFDHRVTKNALWLSVPRDKFKDWKALEGKYVVVAGIFSAQNTGHFGMYSGSIGKISRFEAREREEPK